MVLSGLYTESGAAAHLWQMRARDTLTIRNLPPAAGTALDKIRKFRVSRTRYDVDANTLEPTPELPVPSVQVLLAQGIK